jgi:hypothetical protein
MKSIEKLFEEFVEKIKSFLPNGKMPNLHHPTFEYDVLQVRILENSYWENKKIDLDFEEISYQVHLFEKMLIDGFNEPEGISYMLDYYEKHIICDKIKPFDERNPFAILMQICWEHDIIFKITAKGNILTLNCSNGKIYEQTI